MMKGSKNLKLLQILRELALILNREYLETRSSGLCLTILCLFETSILVAVLNGFLQSLQITTSFSRVISSTFSILLLLPDGSVGFIQVNSLRFSALLLNSLALLLIARLFTSNKMTSWQNIYIKRTLKILFTCLLILSTPIAFFSICQLTATPLTHSLYGVADLANAAFAMLWVYCSEKVAIEIQYTTKPTGRSSYNQNKAVLKLGRAVIGCAFVSQTGSPSTSLLPFYFVLLGVSWLQFRSLITYEKYLSPISQQVSQVFAIAGLTVAALAIFATVFPIGSFLDNFGSLFTVVGMLFFHSTSTYLKFKRTKLFMRGLEAIRNQETGIAFSIALIKIQESEGSQESEQSCLISSLLIQQHVTSCQSATCLCQKPFNAQDKSALFKQVVLDTLEKVSQKFPNSFALRSICLGCKMNHCSKLLSISFEVHKLMREFGQRELSFEDSFILQELYGRIKKRFSEFGRIYEGINCENIFLEETIKTEASCHLKRIIALTLEKYKVLSMEFYTLNSLGELSYRINELVCAVEALWQRVKGINSFNFEIYQIFIFYYQSVIPSHLEAKHLTEEIADKLERVRLLKGVSMESINKYMYSKKTCIIESDIRDSFGIVTNVTANCFEVLGVGREQLLNLNINDAMPEYFAKEHQLAMSSWLENSCLSESKSWLIEFGYVDLNHICFQGYIFIKILSAGDNLRYYVVVVRENDNDYILLNRHFAIQGIGRRILKEEFLNMEHLGHRLTEYADFNVDKLQQGDRMRTKILIQNTGIKSQDCNQLKRSSSGEKGKLKFECTVTISKFAIFKSEYFLIKFEAINRWLSSTGSFTELKHSGSKNIKDTDSKSLQYYGDHEDAVLIFDDQSEEPQTRHTRYTQVLNLSAHNPSSTSSSSNEVTVYNNFILSVKQYLLTPSIIPLINYKKMTLFLLAVSALLAVQVFSLRTIFVVGFNSSNDLMFGDGAVSDNNQILEIMYNDILMSRLYCRAQATSQRCQYLMNSTASVSNILYGLYVSDIEVYLRNRTALTNLKYYESYEVRVPYTVGETTENVTTLQFMEYYYYAIKKEYDLIAAGELLSEEAGEVMSILFDNWEQMKFINHNAITFYLEAGEKELNILMIYLLLLASGLFLFLIVLGVGLNQYNNSHYRKTEEVLSTHEYMNNEIIRNMVSYYLSLKEVITTLRFRPCFPEKYTTIHENRMKKMKYVRKDWCLLQVVVLVLVLMTLGGMEILQVSLILPPCKNMVKAINGLMNSENYLLQSYFQLKTYYLEFNFSKSVEEISKEITVYLNESEPTFSTMAKESINLFSTDPTFTDDFNNLLVEDSCQLTSLLFDPWQVSYCYNNITFPVLTLGLINSMTFFQRNAYEALSVLRAKQHENINKTEYFMQDVYKDIDDSIFYMFRLYQATQARMYQGLNYSVNNSLHLLDFLNIFFALVLLGLLVWWFMSYKGQKEQLAQLYGVVLQLPECIMRKTVVASIKEHLQLNF